jgi:hypothetical protein
VGEKSKREFRFFPFFFVYYLVGLCTWASLCCYCAVLLLFLSFFFFFTSYLEGLLLAAACCYLARVNLQKNTCMCVIDDQ